MIFGKIEKCQQAGEAGTFCLRLAVCGQPIQKIQDKID